MQAGSLYQWPQWQQVNQEENAPRNQIDLEIPQPKVVEIYYDVCSTIDQHSHCRQDDLSSERKLRTKDWSQPVNLLTF